MGGEMKIVKDREELEKIFDEDNDINWEGDNAFLGLEILSKYTEHLIQGAGHNIIYSIDIDGILEKKITVSDAVDLRKLNWMLCGECDSLACYV